jgi:hypothetical protein
MKPRQKFVCEYVHKSPYKDKKVGQVFTSSFKAVFLLTVLRMHST